MKSLARVASLLATLLFVIQCSGSKPFVHTIQTNADSTLAVDIGPNGRGGGVILKCCKGACTVLTVAHLCHPDDLVNEVVDQAINGEITMDEGGAEILRYEQMLKTGKFCKGFVILDEGRKRIPITPMYIDFEKDLMIGVILLPGERQTVRIPPITKVEPGTEIYTIVVAPSHDNKIALFSRAGLTYKAFMEDDPEMKEGRVLLQTDFPVGPGASGSPVFLMQGPNSRGNGNLLIGLIAAEMVDGDSISPTRAIYIVPLKNIRETYRQYAKDDAEDKNDSKPDWPYCHGEERLCKLVRGEISLMDSLRPGGDEKESTAPQPSGVPRGDSGGRSVESPDAGGEGE